MHKSLKAAKEATARARHRYACLVHQPLSLFDAAKCRDAANWLRACIEDEAREQAKEDHRHASVKAAQEDFDRRYPRQPHEATCTLDEVL